MLALRLTSADWPTWPCPSCHEMLTAATEPAGDRCCVACAGANRAADLASFQQPRSTEVLASAGVPDEFRKKFDPARLPGGRWPRHPKSHCAERHQVDLANWQGDPWSVLLWGDVGTGKTMLAVELLRRLATHGARPVRWIRASQIVEAVFARRLQLEHLANLPGLVVDDIARGYTADAAHHLIADLIARRHQHHKPTLWTTNLTPKALYQLIPDAADRLRHHGLVVPMRGESLRR